MTAPSETTTDDPLAVVRVIDRLEVGPVELEPDRLTAPYTVVAGGETRSTELVYRYQEEVFEPGEPESLNLAAFMAAQVALNYGLFCDEIVFHGPLDAADRRFLRAMAENTAREILVKKFLEPNPFLTEAARDLPAERRGAYSAARLVFPDPEPGRAAPWRGEPSRPGVLASGGKDSLLSLGLLDEMGLEAHSLFVNESGRHWLTARNAHRELERTRPETTGRVWTSCDRVFSWMLRRLPFVRPDFARLRSDEYPIRLWTVAVFLAGALPLARKRRLGRLVIGDEFDTTVRRSHRGITHYDGLFDQSRYFDEAFTRYFQRKGWGLTLFSLLRQMSELLIQKTLAERYPALHRLQVSCHATHLEGERALPCGRCEKCRRIVGMHLALGSDPALLGYTAEQVEASLAALAAAGVHQESAGARQLAWMLGERGLLADGAAFAATAREFPEVLSLRFHDEASPVAGLPSDLRRPLFEILLEGASGALERRGRGWNPVDPLDSAFLAAPYRFESTGAADPTASETDSSAAASSNGDSSNGDSSDPDSPEPDSPTRASSNGASSGGPTTAGTGRSRYLLGELTWPLAKARFEETDTALLPVGATEQHGPHLPLDTDSWDADRVCREVAELCSDPPPLVLPLIPYGVSYHHDEFAGTLSVSPETLSRMVYEIGMGAARHGIAKLVIVNGHGGNAPTLQYAAQMINRDAHIFTCVDTGETSDHDIDQMTETPNDAHAGEVETSTALATRPELVDMRLAASDVPDFSSQFLQFSSHRSVEWYAYTGKLSESGILGDATKASVEKGRAIWEIMIRRLVEFVEQLKGMTLAEIYERRQ